jgi:hypothetical protein
MALLALSAAVVAGSFVAATAAGRSVRAERAGIEADARARHAVASFLARGDGEGDALAIGAWIERPLTDDEMGERAPDVSGRLRLQRLQPSVYALVVDLRIGRGTTLARRRLRLLLERANGDSAAAQGRALPAPLRPIGQWSAADLY